MTQAHKSSAANVNRLMHYWLEKLSAACQQAQVDVASLGIIQRDLMFAVSYGRPLLRDDAPTTGNPAFCIAKLFTSTLVGILVLQGKLKFADEVNALLPAPADPRLRLKLAGITVSHLLSHTHGLDNINLEAAPVTANGFIDHERVFGLLTQSTRIFTPGRYYSYGVPGFILLGLVIEHVTQLTYSQVLFKEILTRISVDNMRPGATCGSSTHAICPSSGRGLNLPHASLQLFVNCFLNPGKNLLKLPASLMAEIFRRRTVLPGWSPVISGCCYGWKNFGTNWYGQNGIDDHNLMYVRMNRITKTGITLVAQSQKRSPGVLPTLLLQREYPELGIDVKQHPAILTNPTTESWRAIAGTYGNGQLTFRITHDNDRLMLEITPAGQGHEAGPHHCYLYPAEQQTFFLSKPWQYITFVQLVKGDGTARYLWDHSQLWPEIGTNAEA